MRYKSFLLMLLFTFTVGCDQVYTRSLDGILFRITQSKLLAEFKEIAGGMGFSSLGERTANNQDLLISEYSCRHGVIGREVGIALYMKDYTKEGNRIEVRITVGAGGVEKDTKTVINNVFDLVVSRMKNRFGDNIQIIKISEPW